MERINNGLGKTLQTYLIAADRLLLLNTETMNNMQEIKSQLVRLHQPFNDLGEQLLDLGEQLLDVFLQTLPDVILVDVEFRRKITFNGESLTITRRVGVCPICHANFGCCH